jgi:phospholipid/cholesterol/gamma-HCH transport system substrate-binding protein
VRHVTRTVGPIDRSAAPLTTSMRALTYLVNELAYNPPGDDEGFLFWLAWFMHNANSATSTSDAHGGIIRGGLWLTCFGLQGQRDIQAALGVVGLCPD